MINAFLNRITMYRLMLYFLLVLLFGASILSNWGGLSYEASHIFGSAVILLLVCWGANTLFARMVGAKTNLESPFITALILSLIVGPLDPLHHASYLVTLLSIGVLAMASKYILVWRGRHIFNPAAVAVFLSALLFEIGASWWIGSSSTLPIVLIGGYLVARKIHRETMILAFLLTYCVGIILVNMTFGFPLSDALMLIKSILLASPILFFACVMLVEPLTSPATQRQRLYFGILVALVLLFLQYVAGIANYSLELALLVGNIYTAVLRRDHRLALTLRDKKELAPSIWAFWFKSDKPCTFTAGQYLEWTLPHSHPDDRGTRRFFTIASSPTEEDILLTTKFASEKSSSFKVALQKLTQGDTIGAGHLEGEFVLPPDPKQKVVFIAGGIGVTPFRSMIKYAVDKTRKQPITLLYSARNTREFVFTDLFDEAKEKIGLKTVYVASENPPALWKGRTGFIDAKVIQEEVPEYKDSLFYISGPQPMVEAFEKMLATMGVPKKNVKHDYFPGYSDKK